MSTAETIESVTQETNESLIRYVEVWIPNEDGTLLTLSGAQTVGADVNTKRAAVTVTTLRPGEGIAGAAWDQKSATILQEEPSDLLQQISSEAGTRLAVVVAIPVFRQQEIRGVVVLGFSDAYGATEIWSRDDRDELAVTSGHYSGLPSFEFITRYTRFPKGAGVPGTVWKTGEPKLTQGLGTSSSFIRSFGNDPAVINSAIGLPVASSRGFPSSILLLLEAAETPFAKHTSVWKCETVAAGEPSETIETHIRSATKIGKQETEALEEWQMAIMREVSNLRRPVLSTADSQSLPAGSAFGVAIPVFKALEVSGVVHFLF